MGGTRACWGEIWGDIKLGPHCRETLSAYAFLMVRPEISGRRRDEVV